MKPTKTRKVWRTLEATGLLALGSLAACSGGEGEGHEGAEGVEGEGAEGTPTAEVRSALGEGAGEGAGEGEGAMDTALTAADDTAYLTQIGLMRGHLWVGHQLYLNGLPKMAQTHMKHPKAELYSTLIEPFAARGVEGFSDELELLAEGVTNEASQAQVESAYSALQTAIRNSEKGAGTDSPKVIGEVIVGLLRTAGEEYAIGVVDGKINNLHEYQDALGFTKIAAEWARSPAFAGSSAATAVAAGIQATLAELDDMWPELAPKGDVPQKAARLFGAAARIEIQILGL